MWQRLHDFLLPHVLSGTGTVLAVQRALGVDANGPTRPLLHFVLAVGAALGNEAFFIIFLPWLFWQVDHKTARGVMFLFATVYTVGQISKDLLKLPRPPAEAGELEAASPCFRRKGSQPSKPLHGVIRLEGHYLAEYGAPSTHVANAVGMASLLYLMLASNPRFTGDHGSVLAVCALWMCTTTLSRLYFGVHTMVDVVLGAFVGATCCTLVFYLLPVLDNFVVSSALAPATLIGGTVFLTWVYPKPVVWANSPGDTALILAACTGTEIGSRLVEPNNPYVDAAFSFTVPTAASIARFLLGAVTMLLTRLVVKSITVPLLLAVMGRRYEPAAGEAVSQSDSGRNGAQSGNLRRRHIQLEYENNGSGQIADSTPRSISSASIASKVSGASSPAAPSQMSGAAPQALAPREILPGKRYEIELPSKLLTYGAVGFNAAFTVPFLFRFLPDTLSALMPTSCEGQGPLCQLHQMVLDALAALRIDYGL